MATTATTVPIPATAVPDADRRLRAAATFFTVAVLLHNGDHLRRGGDSVSLDVFVAGTLAIVVEVGVVVLVFAGHRLAPQAAVAAGFPLALGYVIVHALPARSWLSDSLVESGAENLSRAAALLEIIAALTLGVAGALAMRRHAGGRARPLTAALRHPAVLALALGNVVILIGSIATR